jgi:hypothetical protein
MEPRRRRRPGRTGALGSGATTGVVLLSATTGALVYLAYTIAASIAGTGSLTAATSADTRRPTRRNWGRADFCAATSADISVLSVAARPSPPVCGGCQPIGTGRTARNMLCSSQTAGRTPSAAAWLTRVRPSGRAGGRGRQPLPAPRRWSGREPAAVAHGLPHSSLTSRRHNGVRRSSGRSHVVARTTQGETK